MSLPNYFLADLPPEAELTPVMVTAAEPLHGTFPPPPGLSDVPLPQANNPIATHTPSPAARVRR